MPMAVEVSPPTLPTEMADSGGNFRLREEFGLESAVLDWIWAF